MTTPENRRESSAARASDFEELRLWVAEHLNAIDLDDVDGDTAQVLSSLDYIVHGRIGCTEQSDYTPEQWQVLLLCKEATLRAV